MAEHAKIATDSNSGEVLCGGCFQKFTCKLTYIDHQISCQPSQQQLFGHQDAYRNTGNYTNTCGNTVDTNTNNKLPQSSTCSTEPNIGTSHASSAYVKSVCVKQDVDNIQEELMKKEVSQDSGSATKQRSISSVHRHTCDHCNKTYSRKDHLSRHRLVHTGVKDFQCTYCGKEFYRKDKLQRHKKTHEGSSLFVCQTCGKKFTRKEKLNQHESTHLNS